MNHRFESLWTAAADDGASCLAGVVPTRDDDEVTQLLAAWTRERSDRIECSLLLDRACRIFNGLLADGDFSPRRRVQVVRLMEAVQAIRDGGGGGGGKRT